MEASGARKQKGRSPRYPGIDLELALHRARQLWNEEAHYPTNVQVALRHWGYAPKSGGGAVALAALKSFGLLDDEGSGDARKVWLTTRAQDILMTDDEAYREEAIREAALLPPAHQDLWDRYGPQLPSDQSLQLYLMRERGFTPSGASELASEYKRTISFARLTERGATVSPDGRQEEESVTPAPSAEAVTRPAPPRAYGGGAGVSKDQIVIPVPLREGMGTISLPRYLSQGSWDVILAVLKAYEPSLTADAPDASSGD
jgi:hypothetical protein